MTPNSLVRIKDERFDQIMEAWVENINLSVFTLHMKEDPYFYDQVHFLVADCSQPDREWQVTTDLKKILRKRRVNQGKTILVGYDTQYLKPDVLEAILNKIRAISAYKHLQFSQITAAKLTESVDYLLYEEYYIPDLIFVVIQK